MNSGKKIFLIGVNFDSEQDRSLPGLTKRRENSFPPLFSVSDLFFFVRGVCYPYEGSELF